MRGRGMSVALVVTAVLCVVPLSSCATLTGVLIAPVMPRVHVQRVHGVRADTLGFVSEAVLLVENPNLFPLRLERVSWELRVRNLPTAVGQTTRPLDIPARGSALTPVFVRSPYRGAFRAGFELLQRGELPWQLTLTAHFATPLGAVQVPAIQEGRIRLPDLLPGRSIQRGGML